MATEADASAEEAVAAPSVAVGLIVVIVIRRAVAVAVVEGAGRGVGIFLLIGLAGEPGERACDRGVALALAAVPQSHLGARCAAIGVARAVDCRSDLRRAPARHPHRRTKLHG